MQDSIDRIKEMSIEKIIGRDVILKPAGNNLVGLCPFHQEKSPSFTIYTRSNTYKCFGCGKGGDAIKYIQDSKGFSFTEAVKTLCQDFGLPMPNFDGYDPAKAEERRSLIEIMNLARAFYVDQLFANKESEAFKYITSRYSIEVVQAEQLGYAPAGNLLIAFMQSKGITLVELEKVGLVSNGEKGLFDRFQDRIMFPIHDIHLNTISFSGRILPSSKAKAKYINGPDTEIFKKGNNLYGLHAALIEVRKKGEMNLVEGNPDVVRLHSLGVTNTVAPLGTNLTPEQARLIAKYTKSVNIIGDTDEAGKKAVDRSAELLINEVGIYVNVTTIESEKGKSDPDAAFQKISDYNKALETKMDYLQYLAARHQNVSTTDAKQAIISKLCSLIAKYPVETRALHIDAVSEFIKPKKAFLDELKKLDNEAVRIESDEKEYIPKHVDANAFYKYGFYEDRNCYYFKKGDNILRGSNFVMRPLFHNQSVTNAKRLFEIINEFNVSFIIEIPQKDLISLQSFKLHVESMGNFIWEAGEAELIKLKKWLYENTETCIEITQLGWQKKGFFIWANGLYNGKFTPVNSFGIVKHNDSNYYIPAFSSIYSHEDSLFQAERKFIHKPGKISYMDLITKFYTCFGENALVGFGFMWATLFRDIIYGRFSFFPILNLFGPKGAGKTAMAVCFLHFFGRPNRGPNITNTSKPALADHISQVSNALVHIDEYKNGIEPEKIEFLKGVWDGMGRSRMNMDKDKKKETTAVDCGLMLTGQEMPTADVALFSRLIFLTFTQTEYSRAEKDAFADLEATLKEGVTHLTQEALSHRDFVKENFYDVYVQTEKDMLFRIGNERHEERNLRNWAVILTATRIMINKLNLTNFDYDALLENTVQLMSRQNRETMRTGDVSNFWSVFEFLVRESELDEEVDYVIEEKKEEITDAGSIMFDKHTKIMYLQHNRVFEKYLRHGSLTKGNVLPKKTLEYYLRNSKEFLGVKKSKEFRFKRSDVDVTAAGERRRTITTAMCFNYDQLVNEYGINVVVENIREEKIF